MALTAPQHRLRHIAAAQLMPATGIRVLVFTNMYPTPDASFYGTFVRDEVESMRRAGVHVDVYFVNGRRNKLAYAAMPFGLASRLSMRRYDIVHVHHSYCGAIATLQKSVPVVWTIHEGALNAHEAPRVDRRVTKLPAYSSALKRWVAARVDAVVAVSERVRAPLGRDDAEVIPSGIDLEKFVPMERSEAKRALGLPLNRRYVLFPSSPSRPEKRYQLAKRAVDRLREMAPEAQDVDLVVLDRIPHHQVPLYMNACEVVLLTSAFEASPVTIREALACNIAVVSTAVGDVPLVLAGIEGCRVVDPSANDMAQALRGVLADGGRVRGRERMYGFSRERTAERLIDVYRRVLESRGRVSAT
ncbi:MAG TPA: glycosyltransferase family 4 protein [Candidatus Krumholzibacteria bacterium]|nr:glycosyltransferase family 4 protein [Candidatus Krumholzibacteria bacterium]